jgi:hypothetical protein
MSEGGASGTYFNANLVDPVNGIADVSPFAILIPHTNFSEFQ